MRRRVAQNIQPLGTVDGNPLDGTIPCQRPAQVDGAAVDLRRNNTVFHPGAGCDIIDGSALSDLDGFAARQYDVNIFHGYFLIKEMVGTGRIELPTSSVSRKRSPTELRACKTRQDSTP